MIRLAIHGSRNSSTQMMEKQDVQTDRAVKDLQRIVEFALEKDILDLEVTFSKYGFISVRFCDQEKFLFFCIFLFQRSFLFLFCRVVLVMLYVSSS